MVGLPRARERELEQLGEDELAGRIVEVVGTHARTTFAVELVRRTQARGELVAWLELAPGSLFPPDLEASGIKLSGLVCLRLERPRDMSKAADLLLRSGAFALVVLDLPPGAPLNDALLGRLGSLLRKYHATLLCLPALDPGLLGSGRHGTGGHSLGRHSSGGHSSPAMSQSTKGSERTESEDAHIPAGDEAGLSSLVSLRFSVAYHAVSGGTFELVATVSKDKRHAPGRVLRWSCQGPPGLWLPPQVA